MSRTESLLPKLVKFGFSVARRVVVSPPGCILIGRLLARLEYCRRPHLVAMVLTELSAGPVMMLGHRPANHARCFFVKTLYMTEDLSMTDGKIYAVSQACVYRILRFLWLPVWSSAAVAGCPNIGLIKKKKIVSAWSLYGHFLKIYRIRP